MQLLNPGVFFVEIPSLDPQLPGKFMAPRSPWPTRSEMYRLEDTVGVVVPYRSQAERYASEHKPESIFGQR